MKTCHRVRARFKIRDRFRRNFGGGNSGRSNGGMVAPWAKIDHFCASTFYKLDAVSGT